MSLNRFFREELETQPFVCFSDAPYYGLLRTERRSSLMMDNVLKRITEEDFKPILNKFLFSLFKELVNKIWVNLISHIDRKIVKIDDTVKDFFGKYPKISSAVFNALNIINKHLMGKRYNISISVVTDEEVANWEILEICSKIRSDNYKEVQHLWKRVATEFYKSVSNEIIHKVMITFERI